MNAGARCPIFCPDERVTGAQCDSGPTRKEVPIALTDRVLNNQKVRYVQQASRVQSTIYAFASSPAASYILGDLPTSLV